MTAPRSLLLLLLALLLTLLLFLLVVLPLEVLLLSLDLSHPLPDKPHIVILLDLHILERLEPQAESLGERGFEAVEGVAGDGVGQRAVLWHANVSEKVEERAGGLTALSSSIMTIKALIFKSSISSGMYSFGSNWHHNLRASSTGAKGQRRVKVKASVVTHSLPTCRAP